ncbi:Cell division protein FtsX [wastewater metagenome]|uniref:Cell division protein FtsX n=2 Tax=unclassified sequences TaxID=12908 RepID=A0A5B8REQ8_9ZZZZ|nr:permease-like cell division protein FtsX [Arhodomonas sp. KWT]QEA07101.1 cell division protein FtsX [uncultured organism]
MAAHRSRRRIRARAAAWLEHHGRAVLGALGRLRMQWLATLMTAGVIGIALALPALFVVFMDNTQNVLGDWDGRPRVSVFLERDAPMDRARETAQRLRGRDDVRAVEVLTPEAALAEFRAHTQMDRALSLLESNPLPGVLLVEPPPGLSTARIDALTRTLEGLDIAAEVRLDREWVQRLHAIITLLARLGWLIAGLLALAVLLVVGNTIRLEIENRREEIVITKLLGATDAFVRRPFLYTGLWHGLFGGAIAAILVETAYLLLAGPANTLARSYASGFRLQGLDPAAAATLLACGVLLGLLGAWIAVGRHLSTIEPR